MSIKLLSIGALVAAAVADGTVDRLANDPTVQFGDTNRPRLGATLLPEEAQDSNEYVEETVRWRTIMANYATRYSKPQYKEGALIGSVRVSLFEMDIARDMKGKDLDAVKKLLGRNQNALALAGVLRFVDRLIVQALVDLNELSIWQAIVEGVAHLGGNNAYNEDVQYPNPDGHRVTTGGDWTDPTYDPFDDISAGQSLFGTKGLRAVRAFAGTPVINTLLSHPKVMARATAPNATPQNVPITLATLNAIFERDNLPAIERYDELGRTEEGTKPFLHRDAFVMTAATDNTVTIDPGDGRQVGTINNAIGYTGIGIPHNREVAGRATTLDYDNHKGGGIDATGWQTSAPVVTEPEAIYAIRGIRTGA